MGGNIMVKIYSTELILPIYIYFGIVTTSYSCIYRLKNVYILCCV